MTTTTAIVLERDNVNDETVTLVRWYVQHGEKVQIDTLVAEVETSKANIEVSAPEAGYLVWACPAGVEIEVSAPIGYISSESPSTEPTFGPPLDAALECAPPAEPSETVAGTVKPTISVVATKPLPSASTFPLSSDYRQRFSPLAEKMMRANGLTAADFAGKSAVRKRDVLELLNGGASPESPSVAATRLRTLTSITVPYREVPLSKMKNLEGRMLASARANSVQSAVSVICFTRGLRHMVENELPGVDVSAMIVYEVSRLLRKYPTLNATYHEGVMRQYLDVNVGYAMDDGRGLKVPVLHNCDALPLPECSELLHRLTLAYVEDKLTPSLLGNGTFTVTDLSSMGTSSFLPLIVENQSGILGVGAEQFAPGSDWGSYALTLAFDHQLCDGRTAALFLNDLKDRLLSYEETLRKESADLACSACGRKTRELTLSNHRLLRSVEPDGYLCTLCATGY